MVQVSLSNVLMSLKDQGLFFSVEYGKKCSLDATITATEILAHKAQPHQALFLNIHSDEQIRYVQDGLQRKVSCVILPTHTINHHFDLPDHAAIIFTHNVPQALAHITYKYFLKRPQYVLAVTGSSGKTGTTSFIHQIATQHGMRSAQIGTMGVQSNIASFPRSLTTPNPVDMTRYINALTKKGAEVISLEASAHALQQYRLYGLQFDAVGITSISNAHLNVFRSIDAIARIKYSLLHANNCPHILPSSLAQELRTHRTADHTPPITYGQNKCDAIQITQYDPLKHTATLQYNGAERIYNLSILGLTQLHNAIHAILMLAHAMGEPETLIPQFLNYLPKITPVTGRMEKIGTTNRGIELFVDMAHCPLAFEQSITFFRNIMEPTQQLHTIFGGSGRQDPAYRPAMGRIAQKSDHVYITDDNPYDSDPKQLAQDILNACDKGQYIANRRQALLHAIQSAQPGDFVLALCKGDEAHIHMRDHSIPHSDREILQEALKHVEY